MPRFFLYVAGRGTMVPDENGIEVVDTIAAKQAAVEAARAVMARELLSGYLCLDDAICIHDAQGCEVDRVMFRETVEVLATPPAQRYTSGKQRNESRQRRATSR